jgi:transposase
MQVYGIDLSMDKFNVNFIDQKGMERSKEVKNKLSAISRFIDCLPSESLLVAEYTGVYSDLLVSLCNQQNIPISLVPGYTIKHSLGLIKGKSDPLDSRRIREYGERFCDKLELATYDNESMAELKTFYTLRRQLVNVRKSLRAGEHSRSQAPVQSISVHTHVNNVLLSIDLEIEAVDKEIEQLIKSNQETKHNYELAISVMGIGPVIATDLLIKTGNFQKINTAKRAASYAGVCPFPNASGKAVGKSKTSHLADKKLKSLLYMGAKTVLKHNKEYKLYYQRKQLEGKPHYLIMNNISNKILRTVYSVVNSKTPYRKDYICTDPREKNSNSSPKRVA